METTSQSRIQALEGQVHSLQSQLEMASGGEEGREELLSLLESERIAKAELESQLQSLRENLVVNTEVGIGKGGAGRREVGRREEGGRKRDDTTAALQAEVLSLQQKLQEVEAESKRQNRTHSQTISSLQIKLDTEKGESQQLRQSLASLSKRATGSSWSPSESSASEEVARLRGELKQREGEIQILRMEKETLAMSGASEETSTSEAARLLEEKDKEIRDLTAQLQKFHKTARDFSKIAQHSKGQSETISRLRGDLEQAEVRVHAHI